VFRDLVAGLCSKNHRRGEGGSRKGGYPMTVLHVVVESGEFGGKPEPLVLAAAFFRFNADGTQPDLLSSGPFDETGRVEVQGKSRFVESRTGDFVACCLERTNRKTAIEQRETRVDLNVWWKGTGRMVEGRYAYLGRSCGGRTTVMIVIGVAIFCRRWYSANDLSRPAGIIVSGDSFAFDRSEFLIVVRQQGIGCGGTAMALDLICD